MADKYKGAISHPDEKKSEPKEKSPGRNEDVKFDVEATLRAMVQQAEDFVDGELSSKRASAEKLYDAGPLGNEEEGRSQVVMSTVRDTVLAVLPSLLRTVYGSPERAVEFVPYRADLVTMTEQQSEYITKLYNEAPAGLLNTIACLKDGLIKRLGFVKWWHEEHPEQETLQMTGLSEEAVSLLESDPDTTYTVTSETMAEDGTPLYNCSVTRSTKRGRMRWGAVPPEEIGWSRNAREFGDSRLVFHRQELTVGDVVAMGYDYDEVVEYAGEFAALETNAETIQRKPGVPSSDDGSQSADPSSWKIPYYEIYARIDEDDDHIGELRRYTMVGDARLLKPLEENEGFLGIPVREIPITAWCPDPKPHTVEGGSWADLTGDLQRIETALIRGNLDSLGLALHPRLAYRVGEVNAHDVLNTEIGAVLRTTSDPRGALMEFAHSYVGKEAFPLIEHIKNVKQDRTGQNQGAAGLQADALQSQTKSGVDAALSQAQARIELVARIYAEQILVPLFRGLYRGVKQHQTYEEIVKMRGAYVTVDPRTWTADCEVRVNIMLGGGLQEQRMASMAGIVSKQENIISLLGPGNPLVGLDKYSAALLKLITVAGHPEAETYFNRISPEQAQAIAQQVNSQPPKEDPATMLARAQAQEIQIKLQIEQQKVALDMAKFQFEKQLEMEKLRQELVLKAREMELKYAAEVDEATMQQAIEGNKVALKTLSERQDAERDAALELHKNATDAALELHKIETKAEVDVRTARIKAEAKPSQER